MRKVAEAEMADVVSGDMKIVQDLSKNIKFAVYKKVRLFYLLDNFELLNYIIIWKK